MDSAIANPPVHAVISPARRVQAREIWWINPWKLALFFLVPVYILVYAAPLVLGPEIATVRFRYYFDTEFFLVGLAFLLVLTAWAALFVQLNIGGRGNASGKQVRIDPVFLDALALAAICAYVIWFHRFILNPGSLLEVFSTDSTVLAATRKENPTIPGVTTATQFGIAYIVFFLHQTLVNGESFAYRRYSFYFWTLIALPALRVYLWGERLALIEVVVPMAVLAAVWGIKSKRRSVYFVITFAPLIGLALLVLFFGATEFFRSWGFYQSHGIPFWQFILTRIITYYYTALNNGAGMLAILDRWPTWEFSHLLAWLHRFPFSIGERFGYLVGHSGYVGKLPIENAWLSSTFLDAYGDPEFNNLSGIFVVFFDIGVPLGILYAAIWGAALGFWYNQLIRGEGLGSLMYPACYLSLLEIFRILYFGDQRAFPVFLAILLGYFLFSSGKRRTESAQSSRSSQALLLGRA